MPSWRKGVSKSDERILERGVKGDGRCSAVVVEERHGLGEGKDEKQTHTYLLGITLHGLVRLENLLAVFFVADGEEGCALDWCHCWFAVLCLCMFLLLVVARVACCLLLLVSSDVAVMCDTSFIEQETNTLVLMF